MWSMFQGHWWNSLMIPRGDFFIFSPGGFSFLLFLYFVCCVFFFFFFSLRRRFVLKIWETMEISFVFLLFLPFSPMLWFPVPLDNMLFFSVTWEVGTGLQEWRSGWDDSYGIEPFLIDHCAGLGIEILFQLDWSREKNVFFFDLAIYFVPVVCLSQPGFRGLASPKTIMSHTQPSRWRIWPTLCYCSLTLVVGHSYFCAASQL